MNTYNNIFNQEKTIGVVEVDHEDCKFRESSEELGNTGIIAMLNKIPLVTSRYQRFEMDITFTDQDYSTSDIYDLFKNKGFVDLVQNRENISVIDQGISTLVTAKIKYGDVLNPHLVYLNDGKELIILTSNNSESIKDYINYWNSLSLGEAHLSEFKKGKDVADALGYLLRSWDNKMSGRNVRQLLDLIDLKEKGFGRNRGKLDLTDEKKIHDLCHDLIFTISNRSTIRGDNIG